MSSVRAMGPGTSWKDAATVPGATARTATAGPVYYRPFWVLVAATFFLGFCTGLVWLVTWWSRPRPIQTLVLAAGYESNLAVPQNSLGRRWANELATRTGTVAAEFRRDSRWDAPLRKVRAQTLILTIVAHGGADETGPYLLPSDTQLGPAPENRVRMTEVMERLGGLAADTRKVLILESGGMPANPYFGPTDAEFATALEKLDFAAQPNLAVITAHGPGERSWPAEIHDSTVFGHYLAAGLNGSADADGDHRVTLWELFEFVAPHVEEWTARNRAAKQRPRLYPAGPEGERRARAVVVAMVKSQPAPAAESQTAYAPSPSLATAWERYAERSRLRPAPASHAPHLWRVYGATLLRAEELALARDYDSATAVLAQAAELETLLDGSRSSDVGDPQLVDAVFGSPRTHADTRAMVDKLWTAAPDAATKVAESVLPSSAVYDVLIDRAAEDPARSLGRAAEVVRLIDRPGRPRPASAQLLLFLANQFPPNRAGEHALLIRTALTVHRRGELAATAGGQGLAERIAPWIEARLKAADGERVAGIDRLFATDPGDAATRLESARRGYDAVLAQAAQLRRAFEARDRLFAELPFLGIAVDRAPANDDSLAAPVAEELVKLWVVAHDFENALVPASDPADLARSADDAIKRLDAVTGRIIAPANQFVPAPPPGLAPRAGRDAIELALALPTTPPEVRAKLSTLFDRFVRDAAEADIPATLGSQTAPRRAVLAAAALGRGETMAPHVRVPKLSSEIRRALDTDPTGDPIKTRTAYKAAERLARMLPVAVAPLRVDPAVIVRNLLAQDFALGLAERHASHFWAGDSHDANPYYQIAAGRLTTDVAALGPLDLVRERLGRLRGLVERPIRMNVSGSSSVTTTDATPFALEVGLDGPRSDILPGSVTVWAEPRPGLKLVGTGGRLSLPWPGTTRHRVIVANDSAENRESGIQVRGFFRGWDFSGPAPAILSPVPDVIAVSAPAASSAAVTLRASAEAIRKYGCGDGSIALVLDCSGSMAAPEGRPAQDSRYQQGVVAAGKIMAAMPRDTVFSVWAFGQAGEGRKKIDAVEQTITKIAGPFRRDPDDATQVSQVTAKLAKLEPYNESPIYRAMLSARDELLASSGYRAVVLVSDGLDNRVVGETKLNPNRESLPALLRVKFREGGVIVHAVGFPTKDTDDKAAAESLREFVEGLPTPGKYVVAPDLDDLIAALRAGLSSRLTARLIPQDGKPIDLDVTPGGTADRWAKVPAGSYRLTTTTGLAASASSATADVRLADGDRLLIGFDGGPTFRRLLLADEFPSKPFARSDRGDWRATLLLNQRRNSDLAFIVGLEATDTAARMTRPSEVWFDVATDFPDLAPSSIRWRPVYDFPAPAWEIVATNWPSYPGGGSVARPRVRAWFEPSGTAIAPANLAYKTVLESKTPLPIALGTETVTLERIDPATILGANVAPGTIALRVRHAPDRPVLIRLNGSTLAKSECLIHAKAGVAIGLFLPGDTADLKTASVALVPLNDFKSTARRMDLRDLPPPDQDDRPAPGR